MAQVITNQPNDIIWKGAYATGAGWIIESQTIQSRNRIGGSSTTVYNGQPSAIENLYLILTAEGWDCTLQSGQTPWKLTAVLNRDIINNPVIEPTPSEQWSCRQTPSQQNLLECTDLPTIALLTTQGKEAIESQLKNPTNNATTNYKGSNQTAVINVYNLMRLGTDSRQVFWPTLTRKVTVGRGYNPGWSVTNVGKVLSTATLLSEYPQITNDIPKSLLPSSNGLTTDVNGVQTFGGWLQYGVTCNPIPNNKNEISQEWQFNPAWAAITYVSPL